MAHLNLKKRDNEGYVMWIDVNDELPVDNKPKICRARIESDVFSDGFRDVHFEAWYSSDDGFWTDWCGDIENDDDWYITHWMNIPL